MKYREDEKYTLSTLKKTVCASLVDYQKNLERVSAYTATKLYATKEVLRTATAFAVNVGLIVC